MNGREASEERRRRGIETDAERIRQPFRQEAAARAVVPASE
ncbi:hypothetical protein [Streptomyces erythrochromogenes]